MKTKMASWETPPKEGDKFYVRTDSRRIILCRSLAEFEKNKEALLKGEEIVGWLPVDIDNVIPPFAQIPPKKDLNKAIEQQELGEH